MNHVAGHPGRCPHSPARTRLSRRRVLLGLAGAAGASAGLGFASWRILGNDADNAGSSPPRAANSGRDLALAVAGGVV
ncbi:hypothetical protein AB5J56_06960 [Streptomyces sp. R21]|uniref:Uncharacterized protein n=1 Tax=Streptomyces sp. R21 TaxID=3238627 RepID=A0AB39P293_9ACTN